MPLSTCDRGCRVPAVQQNIMANEGLIWFHITKGFLFRRAPWNRFGKHKSEIYLFFKHIFALFWIFFGFCYFFFPFELFLLSFFWVFLNVFSLLFRLLFYCQSASGPRISSEQAIRTSPTSNSRNSSSAWRGRRGIAPSGAESGYTGLRRLFNCKLLSSFLTIHSLRNSMFNGSAHPLLVIHFATKAAGLISFEKAMQKLVLSATVWNLLPLGRAHCKNRRKCGKKTSADIKFTIVRSKENSSQEW